jgi:mRNA-degrading endonuclease toxin of MazEF toxin-antitoxin module
MKDFDQWNIVKQRLDVNQKLPFFKEREVWWCSIGVNVGCEVYGKGNIFARPVVVLKKFSRTSFLGVPLTSQFKDRPDYIPLNIKGKTSYALGDHIRAYDSRRFANLLTTLTDQQFDDLRGTIKEILSL